jgi:hypothetical protein
MRYDLRNAAFALAVTVVAGGAAWAQTAGATAGATTPSATMPNANPYTPQHTVSPNGTPAPDTANQYQPASPLTPQSSTSTTQPGCQAGAAGSPTPLPCNTMPSATPPSPQGTTPPNPQCTPGQAMTPSGKPCP